MRRLGSKIFMLAAIGSLALLGCGGVEDSGEEGDRTSSSAFKFKASGPITAVENIADVTIPLTKSMNGRTVRINVNMFSEDGSRVRTLLTCAHWRLADKLGAPNANVGRSGTDGMTDLDGRPMDNSIYGQASVPTKVVKNGKVTYQSSFEIVQELKWEKDGYAMVIDDGPNCFLGISTAQNRAFENDENMHYLGQAVSRATFDVTATLE
jgi:hypothetical protein